MPTTASNPPMESSSVRQRKLPAALLTSPSSGPSCQKCSIMASTRWLSRTSQGNVLTAPPVAWRSSLAAEVRTFSRRPQMHREAPSSRKRCPMLLPRPVAPPVTRIFLPESRFFWNTDPVLSRAGSEETSYTWKADPAREAGLPIVGTLRRKSRLGGAQRIADVPRASRSPDGDQRQVSLRRPSLPRTGSVFKEDAFEFGPVRCSEIKLCEKAPGKMGLQRCHRHPAVAGAEKSVERISAAQPSSARGKPGVHRLRQIARALVQRHPGAAGFTGSGGLV